MDDPSLQDDPRRAEERMARLARAAAPDHPLQELWRVSADPRGAAFLIEFTALANHRKAIGAEIASFGERFRALQLQAVTNAFAGAGVPEQQMPAVVAVLLMTGLAQVMAIEEGIGVTAGHDTARAFVEQAVARLERG
jgi:hypothetical protein